ncbi:MAG TPA: hypothetical protein VF093_11755 [Solirubrobacterales bacterium]
MLHTTEFSITGCGASPNHSNCTFTTIEVPLFELTKTGLNEGVLTALSGKRKVQCSLGGFGKINCTYDETGMELVIEGGEEGGKLLSEEWGPEAEGGCKPQYFLLDYELQALEAFYIVS